MCVLIPTNDYILYHKTKFDASMFETVSYIYFESIHYILIKQRSNTILDFKLFIIITGTMTSPGILEDLPITIWTR